MISEYVFDIDSSTSFRNSDLTASSGDLIITEPVEVYTHKESALKVVDLYAYKDSIPQSRIPGHYLWTHGRMTPFDKSSTCGGYMPRPNSYPCRGSGKHHGIDLSCYHPYRSNNKDQITLPLRFQVMWVGTQNGYGRRAEIYLPDTQVILMFNHLQTVEVTAGREYPAYSVIGREGASGATQDHLHIECADGSMLKDMDKYLLGKTPLPHASRLYTSGALRCPWYIFDFKQHTFI